MATRGARRKTLRFKENDSLDSREEVDNMPKEEIPAEKSNEVTFEKVEALNIGDSPLMEPMIERKGGDDFLYNKDQGQAQPEPQTSSNGGSNNVPPPPPTPANSAAPLPQGSPKEFAFDPVVQNPTPGEAGKPVEELNAIPPEITTESSKMFADLFLNLAEMGVPMATDRFTKINVDYIRKLEQDNKIQHGLVEVSKNVNETNKGAVKLTKQHKDLIREPLIKVLEIRNVKASPETMLIIAVIAVIAMLAMQTFSIKKQNDNMVKLWMEDHSKSKQLESENEALKRKMAQMEQQQQEKVVDNIPYAHVEVVG